MLGEDNGYILTGAQDEVKRDHPDRKALLEHLAPLAPVVRLGRMECLGKQAHLELMVCKDLLDRWVQRAHRDQQTL